MSGLQPSVDTGRGSDAHDVTRVRYTLDCPDLPDQFIVTKVHATEELNRPYRVVLNLTAAEEATDSTDLLGRDVRFSMTRGEFHQRDFFGIVCRVTISDNEETRQTSTVEVAPALSALAYTEVSRIFQDETALQIVESVLGDALAPYGRSFDSAALDREKYTTRNYCVQYRESNLDFVHRLLEEEGIGYFFAQEGPESLVLFDDNRQAPRALTMDGGPVRFDSAFREWAGAEPLLRFESSTRMGSTSVTVRDHDWTRARPTLEATGAVEGADAAETTRLLPVQATKSIIRTRTVPHGTGHNELSFEDAMGRERVHIRAQRDLEELILNDHLTQVGRSQANRVVRDQVEEIGRDLQLSVHGDRKVDIAGTSTQHVGEGSIRTVDGNDQVWVGGDHTLDVRGGAYQVDVGHGDCILRSRGPIRLEQGDQQFVELTGDAEGECILVKSGDAFARLSSDEIELRIGRSFVRNP